MCISAFALAAIGLGVSAAGLGVQMYGMSQTADANKKLSEQQKQAEAVRQQQMTLESMRRKREIIRNAQVASAQATATASAQGGAESSGLMSALSTVSGRAAGATLATNQNEELGNKMFAINSRSADIMGERASAEATTGFGSGLSSLGGALTKNSSEIHKIGSYIFGRA
jgi:hypothetical protein